MSEEAQKKSWKDHAMMASVGAVIGLSVTFASPFAVGLSNQVMRSFEEQPASASFVTPENGTSVTGQHLAATLRVSNYRDSDDTLWVAVRTPRENTWFPVSKIEHSDGDQQVDIVVGSAAVEQGNYQLFIVRSSNASDGQFEAFVEVQKSADAPAAWTKGLPRLPDGIVTVNSLAVYRNS